MLTLKEMDATAGIGQQLTDEAEGPVMLVNVISCPETGADTVLEAWRNDALWFQAQPGFVSAQLHRGIAGSTTFLNYAVWRSVGDFRAAFGHPEFRERLAAYPDGTIGSPHLFRTVAVPGICEA